MAGKGGGDSGRIPTEFTFVGDPILHYREIWDVYPSNAEAWWAYQRPLAVGTDRPPRQVEVFDPSVRTSITVTNARAPNGHYILDAFHLDRSAVSGVPGLTIETSGGARPACCAFYAGRIFFAGTRSPQFNTRVYFSQILERNSQLGAAHQMLDPTSEDTPDLLPNDGGVIKINDLQDVNVMHVRGHSLIIGASNGVWQIHGSEGIGFRANDFSVTRISEVPVISPTSVVNIDGNLMWWNLSGIYSLTQDEGGLTFKVTPVTDQTIRRFYEAIPAESRKWAKGAFNYRTKTVQWIYSSTAPQTPAQRYNYDRILVLDVLSGSFSPWTASQTQVTLKGIFVMEGEAVTTSLDPVLVEEEEVVAGTDLVSTTTYSRQSVDAEFRYISHIEFDDDEIGNYMYEPTNPA